jgi:hypothetical protein
MKKLKLIYILFFATFVMSTAAEAQYDHIQRFAVGVRGAPDGGGANLRVFLNNMICIEGQLNLSGGTPGGSGKSTTGVILGEVNIPIYTPAFRAFAGAGLHYGSWVQYDNISVAKNMSGYDLIMGLEYTFSSVPLSVSIDYKPAYSYATSSAYFPNNAAGLGIRYYFGKWKAKKGNGVKG